MNVSIKTQGGILALLALLAGQTPGQVPAPTPELTFQQRSEQRCEEISVGPDARTYSFRQIPPRAIRLPTTRPGGYYVPRKWWERLFGSFYDSREENGDDVNVRYMEEELGRPIPLGKSKRTKKIDADIDDYLLNEQRLGEEAWNDWQLSNRNPDSGEKERAEAEIRLTGILATKRLRFDWRENGLELGPAEFQGWDCNSCWAFASVDAVQIARRLRAKRTKLADPDSGLRPNAAQLISCMVPKQRYCNGNWHGEAFTFMVDEGLPLGGSDWYMDDPTTFICDAEMSVKPLTWGYISDAPAKVSSVEEIKEAVIRYGAVTTMTTTDSCLLLYEKGVFNEKHYGEGSHILVIVGWDDAKGADGAWLVKNSYGKEWGEDGFGWFEYGANSIGLFSAIVIADSNEKTVPARYKLKVR